MIKHIVCFKLANPTEELLKLDNKEDLDAYQNDPYHCSVVKTHMHSVASSSIAIDYDL